MFSISLAVFNLIPIPPLDGGQLMLIGLEALRGSTIANEEQLIRAGFWITAVLTIVVFVLFLLRATNGRLLVLQRALIFYSTIGADRWRT